MKTATVTTKKGTWTKEENETLMNNAKNYSGTLKDYFEEYSKKSNRPANNVAQHYYQLTKLTKNNVKDKDAVKKEAKPKVVKAKDINTKTTKKANTAHTRTTKSTKTSKPQSELSILINNIKKMPNDAVMSLSYIVKSMNV